MKLLLLTLAWVVWFFVGGVEITYAQTRTQCNSEQYLVTNRSNLSNIQAACARYGNTTAARSTVESLTPPDADLARPASNPATPAVTAPATTPATPASPALAPAPTPPTLTPRSTNSTDLEGDTADEVRYQQDYSVIPIPAGAGRGGAGAAEGSLPGASASPGTAPVVTPAASRPLTLAPAGAPGSPALTPAGAPGSQAPSPTVPGRSEPLRNPLVFGTIPDLLAAILRVVIIIAIPIIILFIMLAGFKYVTANGNSAQVKEASTALLYAVIGGVIIIGATAIAQIIKNLVNNFAS